VKLQDLKAILTRAKTSPLSQEDIDKLEGAVDTLAFLTRELEAKGASIQRLRRLLFGPSTEKTSQIASKLSGDGDDKTDKSASAANSGDEGDAEKKKKKKKRKGHGRNGAAAYTGAEKVCVAHGSLQHGDRCPDCGKGKVYREKEPAVLVRVKGVAPLQAKVYELERLRCNACGKVFTAQSPKGVGDAKYDETSASMIGLLKYGCGLPFNRMERLERGMGIPLPAATQWDVVREAAGALTPAYNELIRQAAQGKVLYHDDTAMKILEISKQNQQEALAEDDSEDSDNRTGVFTSGIVSTGAGPKIAVFFTGRKHAGENLADLLKKRAAELPPPIQMCDALSRNMPKELNTIVANCMAHSRRKYVEVSNQFPDECLHVLGILRQVYKHDATTKEKNMTDEQRLAFHQANSGPLMEDLKKWLSEQFEEKKVEPNSSLGEAISYMKSHWEKLTRFLTTPGAPLDNNVVERALKKAILHRKNALFYKTKNGARVGDIFMSHIYTCELNGVDPFDYLTELQRHADEVASNPQNWMPWNYKNMLTDHPADQSDE
jgi:hypothetical protein